MTILVKIGSVEKDITEADPNWINEQIDRRRADGAAICVQVTIIRDSVDLRLSTSDCPQFGGVLVHCALKRTKYSPFGISFT